jgi:hypothetical protein
VELQKGIQSFYAEPKGRHRWNSKRDNHAKRENPMNICSGKNPGNEEGDGAKDDQENALE